MGKPTKGAAIAMAVASLRLRGIDDVYTEDTIGHPLLMKLAEECNELSQAILKSVNEGSGGYGKLEDVYAEAGHVMMFLEMLDALADGQPTIYRNRRIKRHIQSPKCENKRNLVDYLYIHTKDINQWMEKG